MLSIKFKKDIKKQLKSIYNIDCTAIYHNYYDSESMTFNIEAAIGNDKLSLRMKVDYLKPDNSLCNFHIYYDCLNSYLDRLNKNFSRQIYLEDFACIVNDMNEYFKSNNYIRISQYELKSCSRINLLKGHHFYKNEKAYVSDIQLGQNFYEIYVPSNKFQALIKIQLNYENNTFDINILNNLNRTGREFKNFEIPFDHYDDAKLLVKKILYLYHFKFNFNHLYLFDDIDVNNRDCVNEILGMLSV